MNRWSGEFCNITCPDSSKSDEDHIWHYCNDNGICKEGKCICNDGYSKTPTGSCEKCDDSICNGHGKCTSNSTCECEDRYIIIYIIIIYLDGQVIFVLCIVILNLIVVVMVNVYMMDHVVAKSIIILQIVVNIVLKIQLVVIMVIVLKKVNVNVKIDILEIIVQLLDLIHPLHLIV